MPGPASVPLELSDKGKTPHERCQDREKCTGPGCRRRTGKTAVKNGATRKAVTDELARVRAAQRAEPAA